MATSKNTVNTTAPEAVGGTRARNVERLRRLSERLSDDRLEKMAEQVTLNTFVKIKQAARGQ